MRIVIRIPCQRAKQPFTLGLVNKLQERARALAMGSEVW
jgi:hypothetical protein